MFHDLMIYDTKDILQNLPSFNSSIEAIFSEINFFSGDNFDDGDIHPFFISNEFFNKPQC